MWKNIQVDAKERFGYEGWQKKISGNFPRYWSTCSQNYGEFTTPTVRWRLEMDAPPQKPTSASSPWETTNSFYGAALDMYEKKSYNQHVTSTVATPVNAKSNRYQRSRYNPHPGVRLDKIPGLKTKDDFVDQGSLKASVKPEVSFTGSLISDIPKKKTLRTPRQGPSVYEKFQSSRYVTPWKPSYKS